MKYDVLVIGAGISGATIAHLYATKKHARVLVIDKRDHIGGNCFDYIDHAGIRVPKYGPHFFHTSDEEVWKFVSRFTAWIPYEHRVLAYTGGMFVPVPVNIKTVEMLFGISLKTPRAMRAWLKTHGATFSNPQTSEEIALNRVGEELYHRLFKHYTKKHWDRDPRDLDASVLARIPVRDSYDDRYFSDPYQAMPLHGYTKLFEKMLAHPHITVQLNTDYFQIKDTIQTVKKLYFTGPIDQFFRDQNRGALEYRSLRFEFETLPQEFFQSVAQVNYTDNTEAFSRITEPKHATGQIHPSTTIIREYGTWEGEPYYPVPNPENQNKYAYYQGLAQKLERNGVYFVGRLANYKYFNMDQAFRNALDLFARVEKIHLL